jgi:hypothetical protein
LATFCVTFAFSETFVMSSALFIVPPFLLTPAYDRQASPLP